MTQSSYVTLERRFHHLQSLQDAAAILHWDGASMMPDGAAANRSDQLSALTKASHSYLTDPETAELLAKAEDLTQLTRWQRANLREMRRQYDAATALPIELKIAWSEAGRACEMIWRQARRDNDFKALIKPLSKVMALTRDVAEVYADQKDLGLYDALLDQFEPGLRNDRLIPIFATLEEKLPDLFEQAMAHEDRQGSPRPLGDKQTVYPIEIQKDLARLFMTRVGFDFNHGRLDESLHPFTGGTPDDVRLTTRYSDDDFIPSLMGVLHETGHGMYERGLPKKWRGQPVGGSMGMAVHESQSLIIEMQAGRSDAFIGYYARKVRQAFGKSGKAWAKANFRRHLRRVSRGLIRVDADEVSYPLHILLRYKLEQALLSGDLRVKDLPGAWNDQMQRLVGITPPNDRNGCLQDIHWMDGAVGYFPTYTLGAIAAAQLFKAACDKDPSIMPALAKGDFAPLMAWLSKNVHKHGRYYPDAETLLRRVTGRGYDVDGFLQHLATRYL